MTLRINEHVLVSALDPENEIASLDLQTVLAFVLLDGHDRKLTHENMRELIGLCLEGTTILSSLQVLVPVQKACTEDGHPLQALTEGIPGLTERLTGIRKEVQSKVKEMQECAPEEASLN